MKDDSVSIHPTAVVEEPCEIGPGTRVWHYSHLMPGCRLGESCNIGQNVFIASGVVLGRNVKVQNNVSIYEGVVCEDDVFLGPSMVFTNIRTPRSHVPRKGKYERTVVKRGATIGANATVICPRVIGEYAMVGAGAVVTHDVPPYALVVGNPARPIGWVCRCGATLVMDRDMLICNECREQYVLEEGGLYPRGG